jgi:electron transport complex protein RnfD
VRGIMLNVIVALLPAAAASCWFFGWEAARLLAVCTATCVLTEYACRRLMRRNPGIDDGSAVVTGLLLAFNLPPGLPLWMAALGSIAAIAVVKQVYGGIGYNLFNPALAGRAMLLVAFPVAMTTWYAPHSGGFGVDAITTATPLGAWKTAWSAGAAPTGFFEQFPLRNLLVGNRPGCIGETSSLAILLGAAYLLARRCITWHIPATYLGTLAIFATLLHFLDPAVNLPASYHLLSGGVLLGACFMATDPVTSPVTPVGRILFGAGCGILTLTIRRWGGYPEGTSFAILILNSLTPLLNRLTHPPVYGHRRTDAGRTPGLSRRTE